MVTNAPSRLSGLTAHILQLSRDEEVFTPLHRPYAFRYEISLQNRSGERVQVLGRRWLLKDRAGHTDVIEGEAVVGQKPWLDHGESFVFESFHAVSGQTEATGRFFARTEADRFVFVPLEPFALHCF